MKNGLVTLCVIACDACGAAFSDTEVKEAVVRVASSMEKEARLTQQTLPVGQTLTLPNGNTLSVTRVSSELAGVTAPEGHRLVVLDVVLKNAASDALPLDPLQDFSMTEIAGRRYQPLEARGLPETGIAAGQEARGMLVFAVQSTATDLRFIWHAHPFTAFTLG
jgi:hypothetical protein